MKKYSRRQLLTTTAGVLLLSVSPVAVAAPSKNNAPSNNQESTSSAQFVAVRVWPAEAYTRATIESSAPLEYKHFMLNNPERLVVDIRNAHLNEIIKTLSSKVLARDPYLKTIRVEQHDAETIRIVFDLKTKVEPQIFTLNPIANFKNRLVIDLYPAVVLTEEDPLMSLLQDYRNGKVRSDGSTKITAKTSIPDQKVDISSAPSESNDVLGDKIREILAKQKKPSTGKIADTPKTTSGKKRQIIVVLDPGHGGEDPGAIGPSNLYEKNVVLNIARACRHQLEKMGYKVYMTRNEDVLIPLAVRVAKARKLKADIFISIHADAFTNPSARGTGVYVLSKKGASSSSAASYLAKTQNMADAIGGVRSTGDSMVDSTLFDLMQTATMNDSMKLGKFVLNHLSKINPLHKGHVEQAAFAVLKAPDVPSILVETAFISNPQEEKLLASAQFRNQIASMIADGVHAYFKSGVSIR